ncbi:L-aspartate oxidase [Campylobacterota bacterium]|nr:L-aspartate oxidase [Campylobacterota bacterium]
MQIDVLIIGSGVAALSAAIHLPRDMRVLMISKDVSYACNSVLAQGGVACPIDEEDIPLHIEDTLKAGAGACDRPAVDLLVNRGYTLIRDLVAMGMPFDRDADGQLLHTKEAAHSKARILHASGDQTGLKLRNFLESRFDRGQGYGTIVDLLIDNGRCYGAVALLDGELIHIYAHDTIIASGGYGGLYKISTSNSALLGQLHGIAASHNITLKDMHFTQFHPTALAGYSDAIQKPLLTEALRGEGAAIVDESFVRFLPDYGVNELCPRDRVARAIFRHQQSGHTIFLDMSNFEEGYFKARFPTIKAQLDDFGYESPYNSVEITPAFHYCMGGIATSIDARVTGIAGLYAVGEAARTGVHGANRLASNSLLEALVFGKIAAEMIIKEPNINPHKHFTLPADDIYDLGDRFCLEMLQTTLWRGAGIVRSISALTQAKEEISELGKLRIGRLMRYSLGCAASIVEQALAMPQSIGAHYLEKDI